VSCLFAWESVLISLLADLVSKALVVAALLRGDLALGVHEAADGLLDAGRVFGTFGPHRGALSLPVLAAGKLAPPDLLG